MEEKLEVHNIEGGNEARGKNSVIEITMVILKLVQTSVIL